MPPKNLERSLSGPIVPALLTLAFPIFLSSLLQSAYQIIDAYWVGKLGADAVASVSVSFPITFLIISLGTGFAVAGSILIAQYAGAKNQQKINHVAGQTMTLVFGLSILLGAIGYIAAPHILKLMGVSPAVYADALSFMRVGFVGMVFTFTFTMFQSLMRGIGQVTMPMYIILGSVILNFILDPLFIYGYGGISGHGVAGAAIATLITQVIASVIAVAILLQGKYGIQLNTNDFKPDWQYIKKAFFLGLPTSLEMSARSLGMVVMTFLIASFGTIAVASYGAGGNIFQLIMVPMMAFSMATSTLVGQNIGAKKLDRATEIAKVSGKISFFAFTGIGLLVYLSAPSLIGFFIHDAPDVVAGGAKLLKMTAFTFGFMGLQFALTGIFRASGNMMTTLVLALVSQWVIQFPIAYILSKHTGLGIDGIWWAFPITNVLIAGITLLVFAKGDWKKKTITDDERDQEEAFEEAVAEGGMKA